MNGTICLGLFLTVITIICSGTNSVISLLECTFIETTLTFVLTWNILFKSLFIIYNALLVIWYTFLQILRYHTVRGIEISDNNFYLQYINCLCKSSKQLRKSFRASNNYILNTTKHFCNIDKVVQLYQPKCNINIINVFCFNSTLTYFCRKKRTI